MTVSDMSKWFTSIWISKYLAYACVTISLKFLKYSWEGSSITFNMKIVKGNNS